MGLKKRPKSSQFDLIEITECEKIIDQYSIGEIVRIESLIVSDENIVNLLERSETSRKFSVVTTKGRFFLKQIPWYCDSAEKILYSAGLVNYLHCASLAVPKIFKTNNGMIFAETETGKYTVSELRTGALYNYSFEEIESSAKFLARMHKETRDWAEKLTGEYNSPEKVFSEHIELAKNIANERCENVKIIEKIEKEFINHIYSPDMELFAVHGDYIPWNIGYRNQSVFAVYDFDNACVDSRLHDLGEAIIAWSALDFANRSAQLNPLPNYVINNHRANTFFNAYVNAFPLSSEEYQHMAVYLIIAWVEALLLAYIKGEKKLDKLDGMHTLIK